MLNIEVCNPEIYSENIVERLHLTDTFDYCQFITNRFNEDFIIIDNANTNKENYLFDSKFNFIGRYYKYDFSDTLKFSNIAIKGNLRFYDVDDILQFKEYIYTFAYNNTYESIYSNSYGYIHRDNFNISDVFNLFYNNSFTTFDKLFFIDSLRNKLEANISLLDNIFISDNILREVLVYKTIIDYFQDILINDTFTYFDNKPFSFRSIFDSKLTQISEQVLYIKDIRDLHIITELKDNILTKVYAYNMNFYSSFPTYIEYRDLYSNKVILNSNKSFAIIDGKNINFYINKNSFSDTIFRIAKIYNSSNKRAILQFNCFDDQNDIYVRFAKYDAFNIQYTVKVNHLNNQILVNFPVKDVFVDCFVIFKPKEIKLQNTVNVINGNIEFQDVFTYNENFEYYLSITVDLQNIGSDNLFFDDFYVLYTIYYYDYNYIECSDNFITFDIINNDMNFSINNFNVAIKIFEDFYSDNVNMLSTNIGTFGEFYNVLFDNFEVIYV